MTTRLGPVPTSVPPHEPVYQFHTAPVPRLPPVIVSVFELPKQVLLFAILTDVGITEYVPTVTASVRGRLVPHVLPAVTVIFPPCPSPPDVASIEVVP